MSEELKTLDTGDAAGGSSGGSAADPAPTPRGTAVPTPVVATTEAELAVHLAVWDGDLAHLAALLAAKPNLNVVDPQGNSPLLLAYALNREEAAKMLLAAGADAKARARGGWEAIEVAALTANPHLLRIACCAMLRETDAAWVRRVPGLFAALESIPDFYMEMSWAFTSWVPLVGRLLPTDDLKLWKTGSQMRMDSSLLGFSRLQWQRGHLSFILTGRDCPRPGDLLIVDREKRTGVSFRKALLRPSDDHVKGWVAAKLTNQLKQSDWRSRAVTLTPRKVKGWLYGEYDEQVIETIGDWIDCPVYDMNNLVLHTDILPPMLPAIEPDTWWLPEYSYYTGTAWEEAWFRRDHTLFTRTDAQRAAALARQTKAAAAAAAGADSAAAGAEEDDDDDEEEDRQFYDHIHDSDLAVDGGAIADEETRGLTKAAFSPVMTALRKGVIGGGDDTPKQDDADGTAAFEEEEHPMGAGACFVPMSFSEYFGDLPLGKHKAAARIARVDPERLKAEDKTFNSVKVAFSKDVPLTVQHMVTIAEVMSRTARHFDNFQRFMTTKFPPEAGFPVQFSIPVLPSISATVTVSLCRLESADPTTFLVPDDVEMGTYVDRSFMRQL